MKRLDLVPTWRPHGCVLLREGGNHSIYVNRAARKVSSVPRHREIDDQLARKRRRRWFRLVEYRT